MERNPEDLSGALRDLESEYVSIGMDPANEDLLIGEIEKLKRSRGPDGKMMYEDGFRLRRVAALNIGLVVKQNRPKTV